MVGPDFHIPRKPNTTSYTESPKAKNTVNAPQTGQVGNAQHFIYGQDLPAQWWYLFRSPELNQLIRQGIANNPNLAAAKAALIQAQELLYAQFGSTMLPNIAGILSGERQRFNTSSFGGGLGGSTSNIFNVFNAYLAATYTLDVFGGLRRQLEAVSAQVDFQRFELEVAYLTLTTNIVTTAVTIASLKEQISATLELIKAYRKQLRIFEKQFTLGGISMANIYSQQAQLEQTIGTLSPLQQSLDQNKHALSVLIGDLPSEDHLPDFTLSKFHLPVNLPVGIPSQLIDKRPDIRAAEALLHAASAQIGVATANLLPQFVINANYGWQSTVFSQLFKSSSLFWSYAATLTQPIFQGGALFARRRAAIAAFQQAAAQYQQTMLQGFQNVADALRAIQNDAKALRALRAAEIAAYRSWFLLEEQYRLGAVNFVSLLFAQAQYQQAKITRIRAQANRYIDTAVLFQSLGGSWWNRRGLDCDPSLVRNVCQYMPENFIPKRLCHGPCKLGHTEESDV